MRVDSPGGSGTASERIARGMAMIQESGKPVVVSMGGVAASGGYYISAGADKIVAQNATITGSIGIFAGRFDFSGLYKKIDLKKETIKIGKYADIFDETRPATEDELNLIRKIIGDFYDGFLKHVSKGRKISEEQVNAIGRGRVWSGKDARENKLVDEIGGINKAIEVAKELSGIKPEEDIHLVLYPDRKSFFQILFSQKGKRTIRVDAQSILDDIIPPELMEIFNTIRLLALKDNSYHLYMMMEDFYSFN
jgi:protease-4